MLDDEEEIRTEAEVEGISEIEKQAEGTENEAAGDENHVIIVGAQEQRGNGEGMMIVNGAAPAEEDEIEEGEIRDDSPTDGHLSTISAESLNSDRSEGFCILILFNWMMMMMIRTWQNLFVELSNSLED